MISVIYPYRELGFKLIHDVRRRGPCNESSWLSVPCLREWLGLPAYESIEIMICHLSGIGISIIKIRYQYHKTQVYIDLPVRWHLYIETDSRGPVHERFSHRKLDFKCNFIVENHIATKFCTTVVPCAKFHKDHFTQSCMRTTWNFHRIWITTEKSWNALQLHRFMLAGPCVWYGPTPDHCHQKVFCWHNA